MVLRSTWIMAVVYPVIIVLIIDNVGFTEYFTSPVASFGDLGQTFIALKLVDILILLSGFAGAIIAGIVIKMLRVRGYQMF